MESDTRFSTLGFFMNQCPPGPQVFHLSLFEFFSKIRGDIRMFITVVNDSGDKLFSGVNDTGDKFATDFQ
jgi:hypothetical protein